MSIDQEQAIIRKQKAEEKLAEARENENSWAQTFFSRIVEYYDGLIKQAQHVDI